jgi:integrase
MDERLIEANPARKIEVPTQIIREICERYYSVDEVRRLSSVVHGRERIVLRIFIDCGLRPQELFALRVNDVETLQLRIDEALKETERGLKRIASRTKTRGSKGYVAISADLERDIRAWIQYSELAPNDFLFPTSAGTPFQIRNYLRRILKPLAKRAGIPDMTYQALRRTCATHFNRHGSPRDTQAQMRHTSIRMTNWYIKEIPAAVREAVESMDAELWPDPKKRIQ